MSERLYVAVVGAGACEPEVARLAEDVGRRIARSGAVVVCGGLGGVMEAACRGAQSASGTTVGILPSGDRRQANPYLDIVIATGMGEARNAVIVRTADVVIAIHGEFGTLSEIALALKVGKPVVGIDTWQLAKKGRSSDPIVRAGSADEAVKSALEVAIAHRSR